MTTGDVGNLRVKLSLDNAQFERSVASMNRTLQAMGQEIRGLQNRGREWGSSIDGLRQKQEAYSRLLEGQQTKVRRLSQEYEKAKQQYGENSVQAERLAVQLNRASAEMDRTQRELNETTAELDRLERELAQSQTAWGKFGATATAAGENLKAVGDKMTSIGKDMSMKITAPLTALGAVIVKVGMDFDSQMSKVAAVSGATGAEFDALRAKAQELGASTKFTATQAAEGFEYLALAGYKTEQQLAAIDGLLSLAAAANMDLGQAADITTDIMSAFGLEASKAGHAADVFAYAQANANTNVEQIGEAMKYAAPMANQMGWSLEETTAAMMKLADNGLKGSIAGQAFASSLGRLAKPTKQMRKTMEELNIEFFDAEGNMKSLPDIVAHLEDRFDGLTMKQKSAAITTLFGAEAYKHWAILLESGSSILNTHTKALENADGTAKNMADTMVDNLGGSLLMLKSAVEGLMIQFSDLIKNDLKAFAEWLTKITDKFSELDEGTKKVILIVGALTAAIGPLLVIGGVLISLIGSIVSTLGAASTAIAGAGGASAVLGSAFAALTGPIGLTVAAIGGLTIGTIAFAKHMSNDALPSVERFGKGVSESTKEALNGFFDLSESASQSVTNMYVTSTKVTSEMAAELTSKFDQMNTQIVEGMKKRNTEQLSDLQAFFMNSSALSSEEEEKIIVNTQKRHERELQEQNTMNERVKAITQKALDEKRELTEREQEVINNYNEGMKENAIRVFSESELKQKVILERMKENASIISAEQAAEVIKNAVKQKDEVIKEANETYEKRKAQITQMRDETGVISTEQADKMIAEATKAKDQTIFLAEEQHQKIVETAQKQADEHVEKVNWETGEILSKWEVFKNKHSEIFDKIEEYYTKVTDSLKEITSTAYDFIKTTVDEKLSGVVDFVKEQLDKLKEFWDENGEAIFTLVKGHFDNIKGNIELVMGIIKGYFEIVWPIISGIVKIAWNAIKFTIGTTLDIILGVIQTIMKLIQGDWEGAWETIKGIAEKIWGNIVSFFEGVNLVDIGRDIVQGLINGMGEMVKAVGDKAEELGNKVITSVSNVLQRKSPSRVMIAIGKDVGEGLAIGIEDKNDRVSDVMKDLGNNLIDITDHFKSEEKKITDKANAEIEKIEKRSKEDIDKIQRTAASKKRKTTQDENVKIQRIQEDAAKKIAEIEKKATKESVNSLTKVQQEKLKEIKLFIDDKKSLGELSLEEEAKIWEQSIDQFDLYSKERVTAQKAYKKAVEDLNKKDLEDIKQYIADKKSSEELSLVEEAKIWERTIGLFEEGSKERIEAQKAYQKAVEAVNKEIVSINKDFQGQMKTISDDLAKQEEQLNKAYEDAFSKRVSSLMSFAGTFDAFKVELNRTGLELMDNLKSQVDGFKQWQDEFAKLSERKIDADLLNELSGLGVKALPELVALNTMTDEQLSKYSELYREKSQLAREQTEKELVGMREDADNQIQKLREAANEKLNLIQQEWDKAIRNLTRTTASELSSLQQIGIDAGQGLLNGLESMHKPLIDKATEIANSIRDAMQGALDIHSPSRVMRGFGVNIAEGLIQGMNSMIAEVEQSSTGLASAVVGGQTSYDYSKQLNQKVNIYTQDSGSREMERAFRRMAFGF
ncbi:phage tail tape measure protein [Lysinibacillus parviboronicapiens]|uniref:phage tail tape measure protein n=1 Tax=Lysinibacillus parviboronicapiens TaxID=436516 RepID=UPI000D33AEE8|nr:phage tail tape measure protein [Lysinibacillus parviboronicapiens]